LTTLIEQMAMFTVQAGSKRVLNAKSDKFQGNIHKRGKVQDVSPVSYPCHIALPMFAFNWSQGKARTKLGTSVVAEKQQQSCCRTNHAWLLPVCGCRFRYNSVVLNAACLPRILFACMQIAETCPPCCCSSFANYQDSNQWRQFALRQELKVMNAPIHLYILLLCFCLAEFPMVQCCGLISAAVIDLTICGVSHSRVGA